MKNISDCTLLVYDHSLYLPFAERMTREFARVLYHTAWEEGFSVLRDNVVGDGFDTVERCEDFWPLLDAGEIDCVAFPDIQNGGLQLHLEKLKIPVWGSRKADKMEWGRKFFKEMQKDLKMKIPVYRVIVGVANLRAFLKDNENKYIKWSKYRGEFETRKHINYPLSEQWLDWLEFRMSAVKNIISFVVEDELETDIEDGMDTFCIDGKFPETVLHGLEIKDLGYLSVTTPYKEMPKELTSVQEKFVPFLKENRYRNFFSTEVRIKGGVPYFTDATLRQPSPAGECELELIENLGEIVWAGAHGELVQPKFTHKYAAEAIIKHKDDAETWRPIQVPDEVYQWVKLYRAFKNDDAYQIVPMSPHMEEIGAVVGVGDTIEAALEHLKENVAAIKNNPIDVDTESLYHAIKEMHSAEKQGISFTDDKIPKPAVALKD